VRTRRKSTRRDRSSFGPKAHDNPPGRLQYCAILRQHRVCRAVRARRVAAPTRNGFSRSAEAVHDLAWYDYFLAVGRRTS
jgi:hypothetical protein